MIKKEALSTNLFKYLDIHFLHVICLALIITQPSSFSSLIDQSPLIRSSLKKRNFKSKFKLNRSSSQLLQLKPLKKSLLKLLKKRKNLNNRNKFNKNQLSKNKLNPNKHLSFNRLRKSSLKRK